MSETPQHTPAGAAAAHRYSAADLAHFAGAEELAAGVAVAGAEGRRLRARLLADEMAAGHCVMMRLAARTDYAMTNAAGLGGRHAPAFDLVAARFAGTAGRLMDQYRRGLLSLGRLDGAGDDEEGEWVGVGFEHQPAAAPEELERRLARARAARAAHREAAPPSPEEQAAAAAADAVARRLTVEARADNLFVAGAPDRARLFLDELSAGHRMIMRLAGRTDWHIDLAGAPAVDEEPTQRAILRLSSAMARLMERVRLGFLALERSQSDPGDGPRKVAGYYWTSEKDMLADRAIEPPANDLAGRQRTDDGGQTASRPEQGLLEGATFEFVTPAKAGVQGKRRAVGLDARFRGHDNASVSRPTKLCFSANASPARPDLPAGAFDPPSSVIRPLNRGRLKNGNPSGDYMAAPRCGARTRAGCSCRQPAMTNGRCRFHGGKSTGPCTADGLQRCRRARLVHGFRSAEVIDLRKAAAATGRRLRALLAGAPPAGHGVHPPSRSPLRRAKEGRSNSAGTRPTSLKIDHREHRGHGRQGARSAQQSSSVLSVSSVVNLLPRDVAGPSPSVIPFSAGHGLHRQDSRRCHPATGARASRCNIRVHLRSSAAAKL